MVFFNENISFNVSKLKNSISLEIKDIIDDYDNIINEKLILSLKNKIDKKIKELFHNDYFIYSNMNNNICTFKHKRGSKDGFFCTRKINTNLVDGKKDYLCSIHSKKHIPKKRVKKNTNHKNNINNISINKSIKLIKEDKIPKLEQNIFTNNNIIPLNVFLKNINYTPRGVFHFVNNITKFNYYNIYSCRKNLDIINCLQYIYKTCILEFYYLYNNIFKSYMFNVRHKYENNINNAKILLFLKIKNEY